MTFCFGVQLSPQSIHRTVNHQTLGHLKNEHKLDNSRQYILLNQGDIATNTPT
jgi:hypothetical protein